MLNTFILKNRHEKKLGEVTYSRKKFKFNIPVVKEKEKIENFLDQFLKEGIRSLGEIILDESIKPDDPLFLGEVQNQLAKRGYIMIKKKK